MSTVPNKATNPYDLVESAIKQMYAQPLPQYHPKTLRPLTVDEQSELLKTRATLADMAREGLIEPCGERDGTVAWRTTELGKLALRDATQWHA